MRTKVPISAKDLELTPRLTDSQAARLWDQLAEERRAGKTKLLASPEAAVRFLRPRRGHRNKPA